MIRMKFYLDDRATAANAVATIKLRFTFKKKPIMVSTGIRVLPEQWDDAKQTIINHPQRRTLNEFLQVKLTQVSSKYLELETTKKLNSLSPQELKAVLSGKSIASKDNFLAYYEQFAATKSTKGTQNAYKNALARLKAFDSELSSRTFDDLNLDYIKRFDAFMALTNCKNSRNDHHRCIRAVLNEAIDNELTNNYPYRKFKLKSEPTRKRALSVEELRMLRDYPVTEAQEKYRDIFLLSFYLIGVNAVDLINAPKEALHNGRFDFSRSKTHKPYSIKVEPEAMAIIQKYQGTEHLLCIMDECRDYKSWLHRMNDAMKSIGSFTRSGLGGKKNISPILPQVTYYWARHTWASIASELDIPKETIAAGLGHGSNSVTDIYIKYDYRKVDAANRKIIDYVNG